MNTMHFGEKYRQAVLEGFRQRSYTESSMSHDLDLEFSGARTVHVLSLQTEPLQDYDRNGDLAEGSRFGQTKEVGDFEQTFTMTQDKSLSLSVDKGNNAEQFNVKKAGAIMAAERDEHVVPELDRYRLEQWARHAGIHKALNAAPTKETIVSQIVELHNEMLNLGVPEEGGTLFIQRAYVPALKLSTEWTGLDSLGGKSLPSGSIGMVDGLAPMKIQSFKGHTDPPGLSGDLLEFRMIHDAFVLAPKCNGVAAACASGTVCAAPVAATANGKTTLTTATEGATIYYTCTGADPRYASDALTYTAPLTLGAEDRLRACAVKSGMYPSGVA